MHPPGTTLPNVHNQLDRRLRQEDRMMPDKVEPVEPDAMVGDSIPEATGHRDTTRATLVVLHLVGLRHAMTTLALPSS
jgi:hypothetical protein